MSFFLRAALVIGVLSYCASSRDQPDAALPSRTAVPSVPEVWEAMPREIREGTAQAGRHLARSLALPASRDTLADADRRPAWRGVEGQH